MTDDKHDEPDLPSPEDFELEEPGDQLPDLDAAGETEEERPDLSEEGRLRLPVIPLRGTVVFPAVAAPIAAGRDRTLRAIEAAMDGDEMVLAVSQHDADIEEADPEILHEVGTICSISQMQRVPGGTQMVVQGETRGAVLEFAERDGYLEAVCRPMQDMEPLDEDEEDSPLPALFQEVRDRATELSRMRGVPKEVIDHLLGGVSRPGELADVVSFYTELEVEDKQELLETLSVEDRLRKLLVHLQKQISRAEAQEQIRSQVEEELGERQREVYLREQLKAIQKELGEDAESQEIEELRQRLEEKDLPEEAREEVERELRRLERVQRESSEAQVIRTYLETMADLPWNEGTEDRLDLEHAAEILDRDHYGLQDVKDRVLEFLAVRKLKQRENGGPEAAGTPERSFEDEEEGSGSTLLFVGPPGVGKTSIARSVAEAMDREYVRVSLGGARDEADIRGHRRTYVGAMPGRIVEGLKRAGTRNPVFLLDEVDKLGVSFQGDPAAALMEVLDPAQNDSFVDHYLSVPFDLSEVLFIATANVKGQIPAPLLDRMEDIEFRGYTEREKLQIARRYLLPRQLRSAGLSEDELVVSDDAILKIVTEHTREAGVRNLERELGSLARKTARRIAAGKTDRLEVDPDDLRDLLGQPKVHPEEKLERDTVGVATGVYYTPAGGDIMLVEASIMEGKDDLVLTGQMGDVMKESARAALTYSRTHSDALDIDEEDLDKREIHIHVPAGAVPKEGPSAGLPMTVALVSALGDHPVRHDIAMTGEITLTGRVLPIGGVKEKVLGAVRAGIREMILPSENVGDLEELPEEVRDEVTFHPVESLDEVMALAFRKAELDGGRLRFAASGEVDRTERAGGADEVTARV